MSNGRLVHLKLNEILTFSNLQGPRLATEVHPAVAYATQVT